MRAVVADTGPLHYLVLIEAIDLLPRLFVQVFVPTVVQTELTRRAAPSAVRSWAETPPAWLTVLSAPGGDDLTLATLDDGERAVIALAASLHSKLILMDDRAGVAKARARGFAVTGTLGLLIRAAQGGLADLASSFDALKRTSFYAQPGLLDVLLAEHRRRSSES